MITVATSGYFDILHEGHIELFEQAKALGDRLIVILNTDKQSILKKGFVFMTQESRKKIIESIKWVDEVVYSIDEDTTQCKTLEMLKPNIFAKGGDRTKEEIPEAEICKQLGIKIVDGLGGKVQASSDLLEKFYKNYHFKLTGVRL